MEEVTCHLKAFNRKRTSFESDLPRFDGLHWCRGVLVSINECEIERRAESKGRGEIGKTPFRGPFVPIKVPSRSQCHPVRSCVPASVTSSVAG